MIIIDGHSHFGQDFFHGTILLNDYQAFLDRHNIDYGLIMPTPNPINPITQKRCLAWDIQHNDIHYYNEDGITTKNPYQIINYKYFNQVIKTNDKRLEFVPLVHPVLDELPYLEGLIARLHPVALKIHGIGGGIDPYRIPNSFSRFVKQNNLMLIIHTDFDNGKQDVRYDTLLLRNLNAPYRWANYLINNQIYGVLNHGAAIDFETLSLVNDSPFLKVALGPDAIIQTDKDRVLIDKEQLIKYGYLQLLKKKVNSKNIVFDIDYNWNISPKSKQIDHLIFERIKKIWCEKDQNLLFSSNILSHCQLLNKKLNTV